MDVIKLSLKLYGNYVKIRIRKSEFKIMVYHLAIVGSNARHDMVRRLPHIQYYPAIHTGLLYMIYFPFSIMFLLCVVLQVYASLLYIQAVGVEAYQRLFFILVSCKTLWRHLCCLWVFSRRL